jgi:hypothetical protein
MKGTNKSLYFLVLNKKKKNMTAKQLLFIKKAQKEYFNEFGSKLLIDFGAMKNLPGHNNVVKYPNVQFDSIIAINFLEKSCKRNKTTLESIKMKLTNASKHIKERKVIKEYSEFIYKNGWSPREAAKLIDKERTTILHHNASKNLLKTRKSK